MITPQPSVSTEAVTDVDAAFEALLEDTPVSSEEVDDINEEFDRLTLDPDDLVTTTAEFTNALDEAVADAINTSTTTDTSDTVQAPQVIEETTLAVPVNNITSVIDDAHSRFSGAQWFDKAHEMKVTIVGQGGIGSWTSLIIARLGISELHTYDGDSVESANMAGQFFSRKDIGSKKVTAVSNKIHEYCSWFYCHCHPSNFTYRDSVCPITIGALDNMNARRIVYEKWKYNYGNANMGLFIDGRLSADELQIFIIKSQDKERMREYESKWLFDQSEGEQTLCSFKQTTYMATMIASLICNAVVNYCANITNPDAMFDLPFFINYNAEIMYFKTAEV